MAGITKADEDPDTKRSGAKGCLWGIGIIVIGLILIASIFVSFWSVRQSGDRKIVQRKLDELRNRGAPVDNASLEARYRSKTDPSDAPAWLQIFSEVQSPEFKEWSRGVHLFDYTAEGSQWSESSWTGEAAERNLIAKTEDLRRRIHELAHKRTAVQFVTRIDGMNTSLEHAQNLRQVQRLLSTEFQVAFADRDSQDCRESIEASLEVAQICREDPFLISHLVNAALHAIALEHIRRAIEYDVLTEEDLASLLDTMTHDELTLSRFSSAMQGERVFGLEAARNPEAYDLFNSGNAGKFLGVPTHRDMIHLLEFYEAIENIDTSDIDRFQKQAADTQNNLELNIRNAGPLLFDWIVTSQITPAVEAFATAIIRDVVMERFVRHGLAIRIYQKRYDRFPENLEQLREVGLDSAAWKPWGGQPFGYRIEEGSAILWATIPQDGSSTSPSPPTQLDIDSDPSGLRKLFLLKIRELQE